MSDYTVSDDGNSITCLRCGMTSYSPNDVAFLYCGNCREFLNIPSSWQHKKKIAEKT